MTDSKQWQPALRKYLPLMGLAIIGGVYWLFYAPVLHSDDWSHVVYLIARDRMTFFSFAGRRPLLNATWLAVARIFGLNLHGFYLAGWLLNVGAGFLVYAIIRRIFERHSPLIAFGTAALYLVYPVDYTHMWVSMLSIRLTIVLTFLYGWLLLNFSQKGQALSFAGALLCFTLSLGIYEAQLGIVVLWAITLFIVHPDAPPVRRFALLMPLVFGGIFTLWRTFGISAAQISDGYLEQIQLSIGVLAFRLFTGLRVMLWAWTEPLSRDLGFTSNWAALLVFGVLVMAFMVIALAVTHIARRHDPTLKPHTRWIPEDFAIMGSAGGLFMAAGFIPVIALFKPTLWVPLLTRINAFAIPGAALAVVALVGMLVSLFAPNRSHRQVLFVAGLAPFLLYGMVSQARIQEANRAAWEAQKDIWSQMFVLVPGIEDGTRVIFVEERTGDKTQLWERSTLTHNWEITAALRLLYDNDTLLGDVLHVDSGSAFEADPWLHDYPTPPYDHLLALHYDDETRNLRILTDLRESETADQMAPEYHPFQHILPDPPEDLQWRRLVQP